MQGTEKVGYDDDDDDGYGGVLKTDIPRLAVGVIRVEVSHLE